MSTVRINKIFSKTTISNILTTLVLTTQNVICVHWIIMDTTVHNYCYAVLWDPDPPNQLKMLRIRIHSLAEKDSFVNVRTLAAKDLL